MEFKEYKLSELGEIVGGSTPSTKDEKNYGGNISWITPKDLTNLKGRYINKGERNITEKGFKDASTKMLPKNSVLFSSRAPIGYIAINNNNEVCTNQGFKSIIPNEKIDYMFLYYLLKYNKGNIEQLGSGTTFKEVSGSVMKNVKVKIPEDKIEQIKIATILSRIDDKIELNNQINDNLQKYARTLYQEKFAEKSYNAKFKDLVNFKKKTVKASNKDKTLGYYPIDTLPMNYLITKDCKSNEEAQSSLIEFSKYDILLGSMRVYFHRVCLAANNGITRNTTFVFEPKNKEYLYYALLLIDRNEFIDYANITSKGSTMPYAVWEALAEYDIYMPEKDELKDFSYILAPMFEKMIENEKQNQTLSKLRDTLLPRLMNGEIDLDKIEI